MTTYPEPECSTLQVKQEQLHSFSKVVSLYMKRDAFVLAWILCRPRKQSLSCPSVNFALVVDQVVLWHETQASYMPCQMLFITTLAKFNCHGSLQS
jgi:hypothetical protein